MGKLAVSYNINIIGGSHPTKVENGDIRNISSLFLRDGAMYTQDKLPPTPAGRRWWKLDRGYGAHAIPTDCGPTGLMSFHDFDLPELTGHPLNQAPVRRRSGPSHDGTE